MAKYWMHNGFLQVEGKKMAKSEGNFVTIRELLDLWPGSAVRLMMLESHYRQPIDWTNDGLLGALDELRSWAELLKLDFDLTLSDESEPLANLRSTLCRRSVRT